MIRVNAHLRGGDRRRRKGKREKGKGKREKGKGKRVSVGMCYVDREDILNRISIHSFGDLK